MTRRHGGGGGSGERRNGGGGGRIESMAKAEGENEPRAAETTGSESRQVKPVKTPMRKLGSQRYFASE